MVDLNWDIARAKAGEQANRLSSESTQLSSSIGRVISKNLYSLVDLPTYQTSAMDGFAVSSARGNWFIIGDVKAGKPFQGLLKDGEALRIATGAVIPNGTFGILRWEDAHVLHGYVSGETTREKDFRGIGEEARKGETLIEAGTTLTPGMVGLLAAAGYDQIQVITKPKVSLILLGDEILFSGLPTNGCVRDSLGVQLPGWLERLGCQVNKITHESDQLESTKSILLTNCEESDLVITTGGTAGGPRDFLHRAIVDLGGEIIIDKVAVRPGHPQLLGKVNDTLILGLPGNPQSAIVGLMTLGKPIIESMLGKTPKALPNITTTDIFEAQENFTRLVPGKLVNGVFTIGKYLGSAMLRSLAHADGFAVCTNPVTTLRWLELPI